MPGNLPADAGYGGEEKDCDLGRGADLLPAQKQLYESAGKFGKFGNLLSGRA
ncbi:hypothetical protein K0T92_14005 [Paenibacillus oenotherae]|uniref:Transposase n=1 Tax=Paenibacillus oenotherae TaxID=1435645 RepID=A0ABS7D7N2_9BACL|nr:hypothetical protein [Paenibacillus oenotherae]MBW7475856.1 hypothetical protein [Paenibacillus oenotherae]